VQLDATSTFGFANVHISVVNLLRSQQHSKQSPQQAKEEFPYRDSSTQTIVKAKNKAQKKVASSPRKQHAK
jgi:hypothetical protein